jgi:hypothetical protein
VARGRINRPFLRRAEIDVADFEQYTRRLVQLFNTETF